MIAESNTQGQRLESFFKVLFATDSAAVIFFLIVKPGPVLPVTLPFTLGPFFPFKCQVVILACFSGVTLVLRSINLLNDLGPGVIRWFRLFGILLLVASILVIVWGSVVLFCHPDYFPTK